MGEGETSHSQGVFERVVELHDGGLVAAAVAVVGGREDGDDVAVVAPVVPLHHQLVGARHQRQPVRVVERLGDVLRDGNTGGGAKSSLSLFFFFF